MLEVDGSRKSGSGTILRLSLAISAVLNEPLHITNIRSKRPQPGLKPQHLEALLTAGKLCNATADGAELGSKELWFYPDKIVGGRLEAKIGTAGSIPMLLITILPICAFAKESVIIHVSHGGTDVSHSPTINYLSHVFLTILARMGLETSLKIQKYGYYPKGMGEVSVCVKPNRRLNSLSLDKFGKLNSVRGISVCTHLASRRVAERQAKAAENFFGERNQEADIEVINDFSNAVQKGSSLTLWATTNRGAILGADAIGEPRKPSERVGTEAASYLLQEITSKATVDIHLADLLVPYMALAAERSVFQVRSTSDHLNTNIWLMNEYLDAKFKVERIGKLYQVIKEAP
ncbi:MAG: RNA 3'-terminal phosphate cyclase [Candidatus Bathyarchaeota archaeon]|nr:RNA 3'-terminal phosphate cyclase [Candidatus Bathyarchaeota archaeon]